MTGRLLSLPLPLLTIGAILLVLVTASAVERQLSLQGAHWNFTVTRHAIVPAAGERSLTTNAPSIRYITREPLPARVAPAAASQTNPEVSSNPGGGTTTCSKAGRELGCAAP